MADSRRNTVSDIPAQIPSDHAFMLMIYNPYFQEVRGTLISRSRQTVIKALAAYVDKNWPEEIGSDIDRPEDAEERIDTYFEYLFDASDEDGSDEHWLIYEEEIHA